MSFGAVAAPLILEGDYSDWTLYHSINDEDVGGSGYVSFACFNTEETISLFVYSGGAVKRFDVAAKTLTATLLDPELMGEADYGGPYLKSTLGRYRVFLDDAGDRAYVLKDGVIIKTITNADLGEAGVDLAGVSISPSGKYLVIALDYRWVGAELLGAWFIFEGS